MKHAFISELVATELKRLTRLLNENIRFSYLRLGDGELAFLLRNQSKNSQCSGVRHYKSLFSRNFNVAGGPGIEGSEAKRLLHAYEICDYLDYCDRIGFVAENVGKLDFNRTGKWESPDAQRSLLGYLWFSQEFRAFAEGRTCLFCGAEAQLLAALFDDPEFIQATQDFYPLKWKPIFVSPRNMGASLSKDLDLIKADLTRAIDTHNPDIMFLSLGGAAKILAAELSREKNIRVFDFGATMRGMAYSGSVGFGPLLPDHHTVYYRVPLRVFYSALKKAHPDITPIDLLKKVHAQLILELEKKIVGETVPASKGAFDQLNLSKENIRNFNENYRYYREVIAPELMRSSDARNIAREFERWRRRVGINLDGILFAGILRRLDSLPVQTRVTGSKFLKISGLHPIYEWIKSQVASRPGS